MTGANLFNCFRIEHDGSSPNGSAAVILSAWRRDGSFIGQVVGVGRLRGTYKLLRKALLDDTGRKMGHMMSGVQEALAGLAQSKGHLEYLYERLIDSGTGHVDKRIAKRIRHTLRAQTGWGAVLAAIKRRAD